MALMSKYLKENLTEDATLEDVMEVARDMHRKGWLSSIKYEGLKRDLGHYFRVRLLAGETIPYKDVLARVRTLEGGNYFSPRSGEGISLRYDDGSSTRHSPIRSRIANVFKGSRGPKMR